MSGSEYLQGIGGKQLNNKIRFRLRNTPLPLVKKRKKEKKLIYLSESYLVWGKTMLASWEASRH